MSIEPTPVQRLARTAGGLYLVNIAAGAFAIGVVPSMLVVAGDAAATAQNIQSHELLYRSSLVAHVIVTVTNVPLAIIFYELFKVVNRRIALVNASFILVATAIEASSLINQFAPLYLLSAGPYARGLSAEQTQALMYMPFGLGAIGYDVSNVFYAFDALTIGYLIVRSTFFPRLIGLFLAVDCVGYLFYSFADMLAPGSAAHLVPWVQLPILLGEGSLCLWLLIVGLNVPRWTEAAISSTHQPAQSGSLPKTQATFFRT